MSKRVLPVRPIYTGGVVLENALGSGMGNLEVATRHVEEGRRIVEAQRKLIAQRRAGPDAVALLMTFERSLEMFEGDLDRLLTRRDRK